MPDSSDLRRRLTAALCHLAGDVTELGTPAEPLTLHQAGTDFEIIITIRRDGRHAAIDEDGFTPSMRDVETLLLDSPRRLTTTGILNELGRRGILWGTATISRSLAKLVKLGRIRASRRAPRGYCHCAHIPTTN